MELKVPFARTAGEFVGRKTEEKKRDNESESACDRSRYFSFT